MCVSYVCLIAVACLLSYLLSGLLDLLGRVLIWASPHM